VLCFEFIHLPQEGSWQKRRFVKFPILAFYRIRSEKVPFLLRPKSSLALYSDQTLALKARALAFPSWRPPLSSGGGRPVSLTRTKRLRHLPKFLIGVFIFLGSLSFSSSEKHLLTGGRPRSCSSVCGGTELCLDFDSVDTFGLVSTATDFSPSFWPSVAFQNFFTDPGRPNRLHPSQSWMDIHVSY